MIITSTTGRFLSAAYQSLGQTVSRQSQYQYGGSNQQFKATELLKAQCLNPETKPEGATSDQSGGRQFLPPLTVLRLHPVPRAAGCLNLPPMRAKHCAIKDTSTWPLPPHMARGFVPLCQHLITWQSHPWSDFLKAIYPMLSRAPVWRGRGEKRKADKW